MKIHVKVTQEDIDHGKPCELSACPIALAIKRCLPDCIVLVDHTQVEIISSGERIFYDLPDVAFDFIQAFDEENEPYENDIPVPFEFILEPELTRSTFVAASRPVPGVDQKRPRALEVDQKPETP